MIENHIINTKCETSISNYRSSFAKMSILIFRISLLFLFVIAVHGMASAQNHRLTLNIEGIKEVKAIMQIGLFNDADDFLETGSEFRVISIPIDSTTVIAVFDSLPQATYGISLYHDLDSNGDINKNFIGIPVEPWGISNEAYRMLAAPRWQEAVFTMDADKTIVIHLRN